MSSLQVPPYSPLCCSLLLGADPLSPQQMKILFLSPSWQVQAAKCTLGWYPFFLFHRQLGILGKQEAISS